MKTIDRQRLPQVTELPDQHALLQIAGSSHGSRPHRRDQETVQSKYKRSRNHLLNKTGAPTNNTADIYTSVRANCVALIHIDDVVFTMTTSAPRRSRC